MRSGEKTSARVKFAYRFHLKSNKSHAASSGHTARERWKWEKRRKQIRKIGTSFSDGKISLMSSKKKGETELPRNFTGNESSKESGGVQNAAREIQ